MNPQAAWFLARGSGVVAYALLVAATIWGLVLSTKVLDRVWGPRVRTGRRSGGRSKRLMLAHESLSLGSLLATLVHVGALVADTYVDFGWQEVLIVGASPWRPLATAWGVSALYALVVVTFSSKVRSRIGPRAWRGLHFGSFGAWGSATLHGIQSGTDTSSLPMTLLYLYSVAAVGTLLLVRIATFGVRVRRASGQSASQDRALRPGTEPMPG